MGDRKKEDPRVTRKWREGNEERRHTQEEA